MHKSSLYYINRVLLVIIILVNIYLLGLPLLPQIQYWFAKRSVAAVNGQPYKTKAPGEESKNDQRKDPPSGNRLVIPSMALDQQILTGKDPKTVNEGIWLVPDTSKPDEGSNTVIVGHRFSYQGAPSLYHLDKVKTGDIISIYWDNQEYVYKVAETKVVPATSIEIEEPSEDSKLTLYTCTPLWSVKDRLVVVAELIGEENE